MSKSHDANGREYLKLSEAKMGMKVELDNGFTCASGVVELDDDFLGIHFKCDQGFHYIDGQCDDGEHCVGIYKVED